jgi:hypothetical protein
MRYESNRSLPTQASMSRMSIFMDIFRMPMRCC